MTNTKNKHGRNHSGVFQEVLPFVFITKNEDNKLLFLYKIVNGIETVQKNKYGINIVVNFEYTKFLIVLYFPSLYRKPDIKKNNGIWNENIYLCKLKDTSLWPNTTKIIPIPFKIST